MAAPASVEKSCLTAPYRRDFFTPWQAAPGKRGCWSLPEPKLTHSTAGDGRLGRLTAGKDTNRRCSCTSPPLQPCCHLDKPRDEPSLHHGEQQQRSPPSWPGGSPSRCSALCRAKAALCQVSAASSIPTPPACGESGAADHQQHPQPTPHCSLGSKQTKPLTPLCNKRSWSTSCSPQPPGATVVLSTGRNSKGFEVCWFWSLSLKGTRTPNRILSLEAKAVMPACSAATQSPDEYSRNPPNCFYPRRQPQRSLTWKGKGRRYKGTSILPPTPPLPPHPRTGGYSHCRCPKPRRRSKPSLPWPGTSQRPPGEAPTPQAGSKPTTAPGWPEHMVQHSRISSLHRPSSCGHWDRMGFRNSARRRRGFAHLH